VVFTEKCFGAKNPCILLKKVKGAIIPKLSATFAVKFEKRN
jgi:hypothetical protein